MPISSAAAATRDDLAAYLRWLAERAETIVVDGSPSAIFAAHSAVWADAIGAGLRHVAPAADLATEMGKVGGVLTGLRLASHDRVIIADDDVRYDEAALDRLAAALDSGDVVRPQNYFDPLPWHACWDTGRMLLNRVTGGDWPGTLAVRRSVLAGTGGYDGRALFENLELVRTVVAAGGREVLLDDLFVARRPPTSRHFWSQRVRQAYDELARPGRLAWQLALLPAMVRVRGHGPLARARNRRRRDRTGRRDGPAAARRDSSLSGARVPLRSSVAGRAGRLLLAGGGRAGRSWRRSLPRPRVASRGYSAAGAAGTPFGSAGERASSERRSPWSRTSIGLNRPLFESSAEHAVTPTIRSISARSTTRSPARDRGGRIRSSPDGSTSTFMKMFRVVGIASGTIPNGSRLRARFSKQLG